MKPLLAAMFVVLLGAAALAQEKEVPKDSMRVTIPGCARNRSFTVGERSETETVRSDIAPGRLLRLNGSKKLLDDIKAHQAYMIQLTGLVRKSQVAGPGGVSVAGGRVRIGGAQPQAPIYSDPARDPQYDAVVIDVESWQPLPGECPAR